MASISLSPSIGASLVFAADVMSAGGSTANPLAARAFVSTPASTLGNIALNGTAFTSYR
jgi:hypothetical protein